MCGTIAAPRRREWPCRFGRVLHSTSHFAVFGAGHRRRAGVLVSFAAAILALAAPVTALAASLEIATDPFTQATCHASSTTNHQANVEPDSFSNGSTIVAAYQVGRIYDGGACAIGFSTSTDNGATWTSGLLPGLTKYTGGGTIRSRDRRRGRLRRAG